MKFIDPIVMKKSDPQREWFEVYYVEGVNYFPSYLVIVLPNPENQEEIIIVDPTKDEIIFKSQSYEDIRQWLNEDDFNFVTGREYKYVL